MHREFTFIPLQMDKLATIARETEFTNNKLFPNVKALIVYFYQL